MVEYTNSQMTKLIEEYVHNKRNREILKRRFIDGITFEAISEEFEMSVRQVKNIIYTQGDKILLKL